MSNNSNRYIPITNIRFDTSGNIIMINATTPAQNSNNDVNVIGSTPWSNGKTIFELQTTAFTDLSAELKKGSMSEPTSLQSYYNAIEKVSSYNTTNKDSGSQIVFYNQYNGGIDYTQYENMLKTRKFVKDKIDYINSVPGTLSHEQNREYMNTMYTNTLFAILATSLVYLAFVHLK